MSEVKKVVRHILLAALFLLMITGCDRQGNAQRPGGGGGQAPVLAEAQVVRPVELLDRIFTTGTLRANEEAEIRSEISGRISGIFFEEGRRVRKGDLLFKINDQELRAQFKRKEVEESEAADRELRKRKLYEIKVVSQEEYDRDRNALKMVEAEKEALESQLAKTEIRAPFDGKVGLRYISEGGYVTPSLLVTTIQNTNPMKVEFSVPEKYARRLRSGFEILVRAGDSPTEYKGLIYAMESSIDPDTRTIKARAKIPDPGQELLPGSFAKVEIILEKIAEALVIPSEAIIPQINGEFVYICENGKARLRPVTTGIRTERKVQVTEGLSRNDTLLVTGLLQLGEGRPVKIQLRRDN